MSFLCPCFFIPSQRNNVHKHGNLRSVALYLLLKLKSIKRTVILLKSSFFTRTVVLSCADYNHYVFILLVWMLFRPLFIKTAIKIKVKTVKLLWIKEWNLKTQKYIERTNLRVGKTREEQRVTRRGGMKGAPPAVVISKENLIVSLTKQVEYF